MMHAAPLRTFLLLAMMAAGAARAAEPSVEAAAPAQAGTEDRVPYTITISGSDIGDVGEPKLPDLRPFRAVSGPSVSNRFEIVNASMSRSVSYTWYLSGAPEGEHQIPPAEVPVGGQVRRTNAVAVRIVPGRVLGGTRRGDPFGGRGAPDPFANDPFFGQPFPGQQRAPAARPRVLRIVPVVTHPRAWVGQQVLLTYMLYCDAPLQAFQPARAPDFSGFLAEEIEEDVQPRRTTLEGRDVLEYPLKRYILFPLKEGTLAIPPVPFQLTLRVQPRDFFNLFDDTETATVTAAETVVEARALPAAGRPADYTGAVGRFRVELSPGGAAVNAGDALTCRLTLSGSGNFRNLTLPALPEIADARVYDPQQSENLSTKDGTLTGSVTREYVVIPARPGRIDLAPVRFSYFDPDQGEYRVALSQPVSVAVGGSPQAADPSAGGAPPGREEVTPVATDIRWIDESAGRLRRARPPFYRSPLFALLIVLPLAGNALVLALRLRSQGSAERRSALRARKARRAAGRVLREARAALGRREQKPFFEILSRALLGYLADKSGVPAAGLTRDRVQELLVRGRVPDAVRLETLAVLDRADFGRFAPSGVTEAERAELVARAARVLDQIERAWSGGPPPARAAATLALALAVLGSAAPARAARGGDGGREEELSRQAAGLYRQGRFEEAAELWGQVLASGVDDGRTHYNLGNALWKSGRLGEAILHLEKASLRLPGHADAAANLALLRQRTVDEIQARTSVRSAIAGWLRGTMRLGTATACFLLAWWGAAVLWFLLIVLAPGSQARRVCAWLVPLATLAFVFTGAALLSQGSAREWAREGIIVARSVEVLSGPSPEFPSLFRLHEGTKVRLTGRQAGWRRVVLANGLTGWVEEERVGEI